MSPEVITKWAIVANSNCFQICHRHSSVSQRDSACRTRYG